MGNSISWKLQHRNEISKRSMAFSSPNASYLREGCLRWARNPERELCQNLFCERSTGKRTGTWTDTGGSCESDRTFSRWSGDVDGIRSWSGIFAQNYLSGRWKWYFAYGQAPGKRKWTGCSTEQDFLDEILKKLDARERQLIGMRYFKDMTQTEIAAEMGISQVQVSRMEKRILKELKKQV